MIKSIVFPSNGNGYIYEKPVKPIKPNKDCRCYWKSEGFGRDRKETFQQDKWDIDMEVYNNDMEFYRKNKNTFINPAAKNLIGKTFSFNPNKINIIFGPNGSGKTTILKALAGNAFTSDGFTKLCDPFDILGVRFDDEVSSKDMFEQSIEKHKINSSIIDWDGQPVYYHNLDETERKSHGMAGGLLGSVFGNIGEEAQWVMTRTSVSAGQQVSYLFSKLVKIASSKPTMKSLVEPFYDRMYMNDTWKECYDLQKQRFIDMGGYDKNDCLTFLFDELDKSLDVESIWRLYTEILPSMQNKFGIQIIIISHSPLVLTKNIRESDKVNFISLDQEYTDNMLTMLNGVTF